MSNITTESSIESAPPSPPPPPPQPRPPVRRRAPCAVCEHLRRERCRRDCPYARHFPGERPTCLDSLCLAYGPQLAARMLGVLSQQRWIPAANSLVYNAILRLRNRENEAFEIISRLQNQVVDLQVCNTLLRHQIAARERPRQRPLSIYDLIQWPTNDGQAGVNEPPGGGGRPPAAGPGEGSIPFGGRYGAPSSSEDNHHLRIGPPS